MQRVHELLTLLLNDICLQTAVLHSSNLRPLGIHFLLYRTVVLEVLESSSLGVACSTALAAIRTDVTSDRRELRHFLPSTVFN